MLALIKNNTIETTGIPDGGWATLPNGSRVSPAVSGWSNGSVRLDEILPADPVPDGKVVVSTSIKLVNGHPQRVHQLKDAPAPSNNTPTLAEAQSNAVFTVNNAAAEATSPLVPDSGSAAVAWVKTVDEAQALHNDANPTMSEYPFIQAITNATGVAAGQVANNVIAKHQAFETYGSQVEGKRQHAINQINEAATVALVDHYRDDVVSQIEAIGTQIAQVAS